MSTAQHLPARTTTAFILVTTFFAGVGISACIASDSGPTAASTQPAGKPSTPVEWYTQGKKCLEGDGVPRDEAKAVSMLQRAADEGHADALAALGYCYSAGVGVAKNEETARRYFEQGAKAGSVAAQSNLGFYLIKGRGGPMEPARGVELMEKAIKAGSTQTAVLLGEIYYFGQHAEGAPDYEKAHATLAEPARTGDPVAQNMVGVMLKDGRLGAKDPDAARLWFEKAALQGNGKACHNLAELWNYRSPDRWARIEALRWLLVGEKLQETMSFYFLEDIKPGLAADELATARELAEITLQSMIRRTQ